MEKVVGRLARSSAGHDHDHLLSTLLSNHLLVDGTPKLRDHEDGQLKTCLFSLALVTPEIVDTTPSEIIPSAVSFSG